MNKRTYSILVLLVCAVAICNCGKPSGSSTDPTPGPNPGTNPGTDPGVTPPPSGPYFTITLPDEVVLNMDSEVVMWPVSTDVTDWTAISSETWCKATPGSSELRLDIEEYDARYENGQYKYDPPRICTVTVQAGSLYSKTVTIVQQTHVIISFTQQTYSRDYDWILDEPDGMKVLLSAGGQTRDVIISSNAYRWVPTTEASWLKVECVDNATLRVTSTARPDSETAPRSAQVKVYVESDELNYETFTVLDASASVDGNDFGYGDHTDWD